MSRLISDAVEAYVQSREAKRWQSISPSQLGGCLRKQFLQLKGIQPTTPPSVAAQTNFMVGHLWETFIANALDSQGMLVKHFKDGIDEPFYIPELGLGGTPDLLIEVGQGNDRELIVVDSKTVRSEWFQYRKRASEDEWKEDNYQYVMQIGCYILLLRAAGQLVDRGILAFASKNDGYIGVELVVEMTPELEADIVKRCLTLQHHLETETLPPCECEGWKVNYCDYGDPDSIQPNKKGKKVPTKCCGETLYAVS